MSSARSTPTTASFPTCDSLQDSAVRDPLVGLWNNAVERYERETGINLSSSDAESHDSTDAIFEYIDQHQTTFRRFRAEGPQALRSKIKPIAAIVQTLCGTLGEAVTLSFPPGKAVFAAIFVVIQAARQVSDDFDAILDVFDAMNHHLRIVNVIAMRDMPEALREASVKLLVQILVVLGVVTKLQRTNRIKLWLKKLGQSKEVSSALDDLGRLATNHHQIVGAATLDAVNRSMKMLEASKASEIQAKKDREESRTSLREIKNIAEQIRSLRTGV
ncbi:hypothetical protein BD626DRAFT_575688 [Schizophyllum amplum]|uniref:Fungal STAND N-terminal Goodbye domain-containing protein n=1 Tax=Schizophyllum amplum TaxID=97359 RepID=A0A550BV89_9AGAR|nr:hypothetical protein BD626DRAFT_575688 [Auriculariopsis ampla]